MGFVRWQMYSKPEDLTKGVNFVLGIIRHSPAEKREVRELSGRIRGLVSDSEAIFPTECRLKIKANQAGI